MEHAIALIFVVAACTLFTRAFPFVVLGGKREVPAVVKYLGNVLPPAIMIILVVYCLKNVNFMTGSRGIPEILAVGVVVLLHLWRRNTLLSIGVGTGIYMILVQYVFG